MYFKRNIPFDVRKNPRIIRIQFVSLVSRSNLDCSAKNAGRTFSMPRYHACTLYYYKKRQRDGAGNYDRSSVPAERTRARLRPCRLITVERSFYAEVGTSGWQMQVIQSRGAIDAISSLVVVLLFLLLLVSLSLSLSLSLSVSDYFLTETGIR